MEPTPAQENKEASKKEKLYIVIIFILLIGNGVLVWQLISKGQENDGLTVENTGLQYDKESLEGELEDLGLEFDNLTTDNEVMQTQIAEQKAKIEEFKAELEAAGNDKAKLRRAIARLKKETGTLREIMKGYVHTIDSLGRANQALTAELGQTQTQLTSVTDDLSQAERDKENLSETVRKGSVLQTFNVKSGAIRLRNNGNQTETNRSSRANMFKTCFGLRENSIAKAGQKDIYIRIIQPDGTVIQNENVTMKISGGAGSAEYTVKRSIDYKNDEMDVCVYFEIPEGKEVQVGKYIAEIYADKERIGKGEFTLK